MTTFKPHVALNVRDVEASVEFYRKLFGIQPVKHRPGYAKFDVENPSLNLSLNQNTVSSQGALSHLGIQVGSTDEVIALKQRWEAAGLTTRDEMKTNCRTC